MESVRDYFQEDADFVGAILSDAEGGAAWTLLHPGYHVVIPEPVMSRQPLAFAVGRKNEELAEFLSDWINLKRRTGEIDALSTHWILGGGAEINEPRWCVIRDVLGWVD